MDFTDFDPTVLDDYLEDIDTEYLQELGRLQVELLSLQHHVAEAGLRVVVLFEGRDTAGKGGAILRFTQYLNPRLYKVVALNKPTDDEASQWYFQRYVEHLPPAGRMVFFDRSWYNRAVVEPVMGFCSPAQHEAFMQQVNVFEKLLVDDGIILVKFWFSIDASEQKQRLEERATNPLKMWKLSPVDLAAADHWDDFSLYKERMYQRTATAFSPWIVVKGNNKRTARCEAIRHLLHCVDYPGRGFAGVRTEPDATIVTTMRGQPAQEPHDS